MPRPRRLSSLGCLFGFFLSFLPLHADDPAPGPSPTPAPASDATPAAEKSVPPDFQDFIGKPAPELKYLVDHATVEALSSHHGHWVFLNFNRNWAARSERVGLVLSEVQEQLHDQPFDFIQVSTASSNADIALHTAYPFHGTAGYLYRIPAAWAHKFIPASLLINPDGIVVWAGNLVPTLALRTLLAEQIGSAFPLPDGFVSVTPLRLAEEEAEDVFEKEDHEGGFTRFTALLQDHPDDPWIRWWCVRCLSWVEKPQVNAADWLEKELQDPTHVTDPLQYYLIDQRIRRDPIQTVLPRIDDLLTRYPDSFLLRSYRIAGTKAPSEVTRPELGVLLLAQMERPYREVTLFTLFAAESLADTLPLMTSAPNSGEKDLRGALETLLDVLPQIYSGDVYKEIHAAHLARHNDPDGARALVAKVDGILTPETADRAAAYSAMLRHLDILDWKAAGAYAARHTQLTPWNAAGAVVRLYTALHTGDPAAKDAAWQELLTFKTDRKAYLYAQQVMRGEVVPDEDAVRTLSKDQYGFFGLLWCTAALQAMGKNEEADAVAGWHRLVAPVNTSYSILLSLGADTRHTRLKAAQAASTP